MKTIYIVSYEKQTINNKNINALLNFCKNKKDDDIICVIQDDNDINDISKKYYLYKNSIIFAERLLSKYWLIRYIQKKIYRKEKIPNPSIFVGSCKNIIHFWEGMPMNTREGNIDLEMQSYVLNRINNQEKSTIYDDDFIIDIEHEVFNPTYMNQLYWVDAAKYMDILTFEANCIAISIYMLIILVSVVVTEPSIFVF